MLAARMCAFSTTSLIECAEEEDSLQHCLQLTGGSGWKRGASSLAPLVSIRNGRDARR